MSWHEIRLLTRDDPAGRGRDRSDLSNIGQCVLAFALMHGREAHFARSSEFRGSRDMKRRRSGKNCRWSRSCRPPEESRLPPRSVSVAMEVEHRPDQPAIADGLPPISAGGASHHLQPHRIHGQANQPARERTRKVRDATGRGGSAAASCGSAFGHRSHARLLDASSSTSYRNEKPPTQNKYRPIKKSTEGAVRPRKRGKYACCVRRRSPSLTLRVTK